MRKLTKNDIDEFLNYYHFLHDSHIYKINYDVNKSLIEVEIDVYWSGEATKKEDNSLDTHKTKLRIVCNGIEECNNKAMYVFDYIDSAYLKYVTIMGKEFICLADDESDPSFYVVCDYIEYEEIDK
ncbi:MAG: hypothetical protein HFG33_01285 [Bacilli bacterium]|nr:hypothetical protein [Bacilli bacterium]